MNDAATLGFVLDDALLQNYFHLLVNRFFKILPIWESGDGSVVTYMESLRSELMGCCAIVRAIRNDGEFLSLIAMLQDLIEHPEYSHAKVKRTVFSSISICNKLNARHFAGVMQDRSLE